MSSILNDYDAVSEAILNSTTLKEVLSRLGLRAAGGNYRALRLACERHELELPVYRSPGRGHNLQRFQREVPNSQVFVEDSQYLNRTAIKKRLINDYSWEWKCMNITCPSPEPIWDGKPITLQLEHINGVYNDNRIENLKFLCPNCHSQTATFAGRKNNVKQERSLKIVKKYYCDCGNVRDQRAKQCRECYLS